MKKIIIYSFISILLSSCNNEEKIHLNLDKLSDLDEMIQNEIKANNIPGAVVLVGNEKEILFHKAYGIKNPISNENYELDDIFRIASMTKAITSFAVVKLWEKGLIEFDDPIKKYIPEFENVQILESFNQDLERNAKIGNLVDSDYKTKSLSFHRKLFKKSIR